MVGSQGWERKGLAGCNNPLYVGDPPWEFSVLHNRNQGVRFTQATNNAMHGPT